MTGLEGLEEDYKLDGLEGDFILNRKYFLRVKPGKILMICRKHGVCWVMKLLFFSSEVSYEYKK